MPPPGLPGYAILLAYLLAWSVINRCSLGYGSMSSQAFGSPPLRYFLMYREFEPFDHPHLILTLGRSTLVRLITILVLFSCSLSRNFNEMSTSSSLSS